MMELVRLDHHLGGLHWSSPGTEISGSNIFFDKLSGMCMVKKDGTQSHFTKRIINSDQQTLIGAKESYMTVSRSGYFNMN